MDHLAPEVRQLLDEVNLRFAEELGDQDPSDITVAREVTRRVMTAAFVARGGTLPEVVAVEDYGAESDATVPLRLYRPTQDPDSPVILRIHGGGWVLGAPQWFPFEAHSRGLASDTGFVVIDVDYRLAPEHPYPTALEDCYASLVWVAENAPRLGIDPERIVLTGDSAGGNLAAGVSLLVRETGGPRIAGQVLEVPCPDHAHLENYPSAQRYGTGHGLEVSELVALRSAYFPDPGQASEPLASPALAEDLTGLPRTHVMTAEFDPVRDVGELFVERVRAAGVPASGWRGLGHIHASPLMLYPCWEPSRLWRTRLTAAIAGMVAGV